MTARKAVFAFDLFTVAAMSAPVLAQHAVTLGDARGGIGFADERFEPAAVIGIATEVDYPLDAGNAGRAFGWSTFIPAEPRICGNELTARAFRSAE